MNQFDIDYPEFESDHVVGGFFDGVGKFIKKAVKNPVVMAAVPVAAVPAAFATSKPKNALKSVGAGVKLSAINAANVTSGGSAGVALNLSKSANPIGDAKKIMSSVSRPAVRKAIMNTYQIAKSGNKDAKSTLKLLAATKRAATAPVKRLPPKKPAIRRGVKTSAGTKVSGVLIDSRGMVRRGTFAV